MLQGKTIVLGVTGSIAAYKIANLTSMLTCFDDTKCNQFYQSDYV